MTDEQFLKHCQLTHGINSDQPPLWAYPHWRYEDVSLLATLHEVHHQVGSALPKLFAIDHEHEEI
jgi:hypothetical protein